uniref:Uncharacterized protein n=1 Tax=Caenorhabditis japonica TaxID=281687 RepID=A0A8R1E7S6_CAEJA
MIDHKAPFLISRNDFPDAIEVPFTGKQTQRQVTSVAFLLISQIVGYELSELWSPSTLAKTTMYRIFVKSKTCRNFTNTGLWFSLNIFFYSLS